MEVKKVEYSDSVSDKPQGEFEFEFIGSEKRKKIDRVKVEELLNKFIHQIVNHVDMNRNVEILRTVLKDYNEQSLELTYSRNNMKQSIKYENGNLVSFKKTVVFKDGSMSFDCDAEKSNISFDNNEFNLDSKKISDRAYNILKEIEKLKGVKSVELDEKAKKIIEIYRLFYNENPDFSEADIYIRIQSMMSILYAFNVTVESYDKFSVSKNIDIPMCLDLSALIYRLFPLGKITDVRESVQFAPETKKLISVVGDCINEADLDEVSLINISRLLYNSDYNIEKVTANNDSFNWGTHDEIESYKSLVKTIDTRIK